jgi:hypothetical protein
VFVQIKDKLTNKVIKNRGVFKKIDEKNGICMKKMG